jgi:type I restriction enzyme, S subunit
VSQLGFNARMTAAWPEVALDECADVITGSTPSTKHKEFWGTDVPFITPGDLEESSLVTLTDRSLSQPGADEARLLPPDTVVVTCIGNIGRIGMTTAVSATNQQINALVARDGVEPRYLFHAVRRPTCKLKMEKASSSTTLPILNKSNFSKISIPLPSLEEQRRIALILDAADELRTKRRQAIERLDALTQAVFHDMFGDLHENSRGWPTANLAEVVADGTLVTYGIVQAGDEYEGGVPYVRTGDIVAGEIQLGGLRHTDSKIAARFQRSQVQTGDIVMSIRATVGTTALVPPELDGANLTQGTARIAPGKRTETNFLLEHLRSQATQRWIERQVKGATFREITLGRLRQLPIHLPPIELQREFTSRCSASTAVRTRSQESLEQLDVAFGSLQQRAFRGDL